MNIAVIGLGLIGGSIAKALSKRTNHNIIGFDKDKSLLNKALNQGVISEILDTKQLKNIDVIYLCVYPEIAVELIKKYIDLLNPLCIITDVSGIKGFICKEIKKISKEKDFIFIGSHPMAGKEQNGFDASEAELFFDASYIITPCDAPESAVKIVSELAIDMGFKEVVLSTPSRHDRIIAFTSQLPHILSCAYVMSPQCLEHKGYSAGSYQDMSRVAKINEKLWSQLFLENKTNLLKEIDLIIQNIQKLKLAISQNDIERLEILLKRSRKIKEELGE